MFLLGGFLSVACVFGIVQAWEPTCTTTESFQIIPKLDCSGFYMCDHGKPVEMPNCPAGLVFSRIAHVCVTTDSEYNDCKQSVPGGQPPATNGGAWKPTCGTTRHFQIIPKLDCSGFYVCAFGKPVEMPDCQSGLVFSRTAHVCVTTDSVYNDCTPGLPEEQLDLPEVRGPLTVDEQCQMDSKALIPHPTECQAYYNCSLYYSTIPRYFEQHLAECTYPLYFNTETKKCEHFDKVECGLRDAFKDRCDYRQHQCSTAHCVPCTMQFSSCDGKDDGANIHENRLWSPYHVICDKDRHVSTEVCKPSDDGRAQFFHPEKNECVSLDYVPQEHGGMMPECQGKTDGFYPDEFERCDKYTVCENGRFLSIEQCAPDDVFNPVKNTCTPKNEACRPCGNINC